MGKDTSERTRGSQLMAHFRHNVVGYLALFIAVSMTPIPSYAHGLIGTAQIKDGAVTNAKLPPTPSRPGRSPTAQ